MSEITYTMQGDYLLPNLSLPEQPEVVLGMYAQLRRSFLKQNRRALYYTMMTDCSLTSHLAEIQEKAITMEQSLLQTMAKQEGLTESFKAQHMMEWVQRMNNLRHSAQEIVQAELIFS